MTNHTVVYLKHLCIRQHTKTTSSSSRQLATILSTAYSQVRLLRPQQQLACMYHKCQLPRQPASCTTLQCPPPNVAAGNGQVQLLPGAEGVAWGGIGHGLNTTAGASTACGCSELLVLGPPVPAALMGASDPAPPCGHACLSSSLTLLHAGCRRR